VIGGKYNRWIVILQEFDLKFLSARSKKSMVFAELISELPCGEDAIYEESFPDKIYSSSLRSTLGMEISLSISRLRSFHLLSLRMNARNYVT